MKYLVALPVVLALSIAAISESRAQSGSMKGMDMKDMPMKGTEMKLDKKAQGKVHKGAGTVTKIDPASGAVTIAHGPIKSLNWPAMTMTFGVTDKKLFDQVQPDVKVEFSFVQSGKDYMVTDIKK